MSVPQRHVRTLPAQSISLTRLRAFKPMKLYWKLLPACLSDTQALSRLALQLCCPQIALCLHLRSCIYVSALHTRASRTQASNYLSMLAFLRR